MKSKDETALDILYRYSRILTKENFKVSDPVKNEYSYQIFVSRKNEKITFLVFFGKKGNKIVIQGNKDLKIYKEVSDLIFGEQLISEEKLDSEPTHPYIGTDESGKGDFFGPLVIAGVYLTPESSLQLKNNGVRDSKELSDLQIIQLTDEIKKLTTIEYDIVFISPEKYNQLYERFGNLNKLMAWGHARVIENLLNKVNAVEAISDKFGSEKLILDALQEKGRSIKLIQRPKAEKFIAVAAASIIARECVIRWFEIENSRLKMNIPKGASSEVEASAKKILTKYGNETLSKMSKNHFKTTLKILNK